ncbi:MAG: hypothetical protein V8K32_12995 [Candidatus Electrothrix gigas]
MPVASNDSSTHTPGTPTEIDVLKNDITGDTIVPATVSIVGGTDTDGDGYNDKLTVSGQGVWTVDKSTGKITFTDNGTFKDDPAPINYTGKDAEGNISDKATVTLSADPLPVASNDSSTHTPGTPTEIDVLKNDITGDTIVPATVSIVGGTDTDGDGYNDKLTVSGQGVWTVDKSTGKITFTDNGTFKDDPAPINYTGKDAEGNISDKATVTLSADPLPVASNDSSTHTPGTPTEIDVLKNDITGDTIVPATVSIVGGTDTDGDGYNDKLTVSGQGVWTVDKSTGKITFTDNGTFKDDPAPINYTGKDAEGNISDKATVTLSADPLPVASNDSSTHTPGTPTEIDVLKNDITGDTIVPATVSIVGGTDTDGDGYNDKLTVSGQGVWTVDKSTGKITFTDNGTFKDDPAPINYTGKDAEGNISDKATVTLSADPLPVASNDSSTHTPGTPTEIDVLKNDITGDTIVPATVSIVGGTDTDGDGYNDKLTVSGQGVWTVDKSTGKITFTDNGTFKDDPAPINYTGKDAEGNISDKATVTLSADPLPVASNDSSTHTPGTPTEIDVLKNDITGDTIVPATVSIVGGTDTDGDGYNDKLTVSGQGVWTVDKSTGKITFTDNGTFKDDPAPINYTGKDAEGNISDKATVTLSADPLPVASNDSSTHTPGTPTEIDVLKNDITGDTIVPATVSIVGGTDTDGDGYNDKLTVSGQGVWTVDKSTGKITFTDNGTFKDDPAPINYTGKDAEGNISDKATVTLSADHSSLRLYKTASLDMTVVAPKDTVDVNDQIIYTFKVENKSNMTVTNVKVSDLLLSGLNCDAITSLASGAIQEFTCTGNVYTLIQEDIDAGSRKNTADVSSDEVCTDTNDCTDTAIVLTAIEESPSISLLKNVELITDNGPTGASEGDILSYTFTVGNIGNVTLTDVTIIDPLLSTLNCETITSLTPGAVQVLTCTGNTYTITATDVTTGKIDNIATVTGTPRPDRM